MNDLISKTEALIKIRGCYPSLPLFKKNRKAWQEKYEGYIKAYEIIKDLPTVEPKTGEWVKITVNDTFEEVKCSACGVVEYFNKGWKKYNYCPNCGAEMERSKE